MPRPILLLAAAAVGVLAAAGGYFAHDAFEAESEAVAAVPPPKRIPAGEPTTLARPDFSLPDVEGRTRHVSEWSGKVLVINFWATWCPPCLEEIPVFNALQASHGARGLQFLGVAIDEVEQVRQFAAEHEMAYPTLHGQLDAIEIGKELGNRIGALPYTVLVGRDGAIAETHAGPLDRATAERLIEALL